MAENEEFLKLFAKEFGPVPITNNPEDKDSFAARVDAEFAPLAARVGSPAPAPTPIDSPVNDDVGLLESFLGGAREGGSNLKTSGIALGAIGADVAGAEGTRDSIMQTVVGRTQEAAQRREKFTSFEEMTQAEGVWGTTEKFTEWLSFATGEQIPNIAAVVGGAFTGGATLAPLLGKAVAKGLINKQMGQMAGAYLASTAIETGATGTEQITELGELNSGTAVAAGMAKGALESITPIAIGKAAGILGTTGDELFTVLSKTIDESTSKLVKFGSGAVRTGLVEAATEATQEAVDITARIYVDENYSWAGPEAKQRIIEAAVTALATGGLLGGVAGTFATPQAKGSDVPGVVTQADVDSLGKTGVDDTTDIPDPTNFQELVAQLPDNYTPSGDETILDAVYVGSKTEAGELPTYMEFESPDRAFFTSTFREDGSDERNQVFIKARESILGQDITAPLHQLPEDLITRDDPEAIFLDPATADEALAFVNKAIAAEKLNPGKGIGQGMYQKALDKGFRYTVDPNNGFVLVGNKKAEGLYLGKGPDSPLTSGRGLFIAAPADGNLGVKVKQNILKKDIHQVTVKPREKEQFLLLEDQINYDDVTETSPSAVLYEDLKASNYEVETIDSLFQELMKDPDYFVKLPEGVSIREVAEVIHEASSYSWQDLINRGFRYRSPKASKRDLVYKGKITSRALKKVNRGAYGIDDQIGWVTGKGDALQKQVKTHLEEGDNPLFLDFDGKKLSRTGETVTFDAYAKMHEKGAGTFGTTSLEATKFKKYSKQIKGVLSGAERLRKIFLKDVSLNVFFYTDKFEPTAGFRSFADEDGKIQQIGINLAYPSTRFDVITSDPQDDFAAYLSTLVHEIGHAMSSRYLHDPANIESGLTQEVLNAYSRWQQRFNYFKGSTTSFEGFGISRGLLIWGRQHPDAVFGKNQDKDQSYYQNFEEWIAEQATLYLQSNQAALTHTDKFFSWFARRMKSLYNKARQFYKTTQGPLPAYEEQTFRASSAFEKLVAYSQQHSKNENTITPVQNAVDKKVRHNRRLGVTLQAGQASATKVASKALINKLPKAELNKVMDTGHTLKEEIEVMSDARDYFTSIVKWGWNVQQLARKNPHVRHLQQYINKADLWLKEKNEWQALANDTIRQWRALGKEREGKVSKLLFALDQMDTHPTVEEMQKLVNEIGLDEASMVVFRKITQDFQSMLSRLEDVAISQLKRSVDPLGALYLIEEAKIKQEFDQLRKKPYFPHARFGEWAIVVSGKNGKTVYMEQVEGGATAAVAGVRGKIPKPVQKRLAEIRKNLEPGEVAAPTKIPEAAQPYQGMPPAVLMRIRAELGSALSDEQKQWLENLSIEYAPTQSFRKRLMKRKNIEGYSRDGMRAYANYFWHGSNHLARISYGSDMQDVIREFRRDISDKLHQGIDMTKRVQMADFLDDHLNSILDPKPDWAQLRSIAFTWWLGFSPASAILNFTQLPLVTAPYLSARYGDLKTMAAMRNAAFNLRRMYMNPDEMAKKWNPQDARLLELGLQQGFLEESLAMELAGVAEGSNLIGARAGTSTQRAMAGFAHAAGWMFQGSEKINRRISFNSAVNLARQNPTAPYLAELRNTMSGEYEHLTRFEGLSPAEATAFLAGKDAVQRTQFEYGAHAKPRFMRGKKGVIFTFYMFLQNMLWSVAHSPGNKRILLNLLLASGLMGLPGADDIEEVVEFIGRKLFGVRWKASEEFSKFVVEATGSTRSADLILHGASREGFGLPVLGDLVGLPIPQFDMSGNIGMGNIIPGLAEGLNNDRGSFEENLGKSMTDMAGASYGVGINMIKFLGDTQLPIDDMKRWERAMPRAMKNVVRGMRYTPPDTAMARITGNFIEPEGRERSRTGSTIIAFDGDNPEHMMEIAMQSIGFSPTRLSREWNEIIARSEVVNYWKLRKQMLMNQYWKTLETKDAESRKAVIMAIREFNKTVPYREMGISRKSLTQSVKTRKKTMLQRERGIEPQKSYRRLSSEVGTYYPNKDEEDVVSREVVK